MNTSTTEILLSVGKLLVAWIVFAVIVWAVLRAVGWVSRRTRVMLQAAGRASKYRGLYLLLGRQLVALVLGLVKLAGAVVLLVFFSSLLTFSFSLFQATSGISTSLLQYLTMAARTVLTNMAGYLPNLGVVIVVSAVTYYVVKLMRVIFRGLEDQIIELPGFHPDWAKPTMDLLAALIVMFALVVVFPYLPGGNSPAFRGVSIFIGVLLSLGSGSAMGNMVAGVILTYMRPFKVGDRVEVGNMIGDVISKNLLVTRLKTIKNVEIIIPNGTVLATHISNYSAQAEASGLILHTTVTIGYDTPWRKVHELLIHAAVSTEGILSEPRPFVFQTALNDSYVSYEINAYTRQPNRMQEIYSRLHANIQESFNAAGVEIMSPSYFAVRDGNTMAVPAEHRPAGYHTPGFRVRQAEEE
jgi:small-conductance mechanosensitive channel